MTQPTPPDSERESVADTQLKIAALYAAADYLAECLEWDEYADILQQIAALEQGT